MSKEINERYNKSLTPAYREGWDRIWGKKAVCVNKDCPLKDKCKTFHLKFNKDVNFISYEYKDGCDFYEEIDV